MNDIDGKIAGMTPGQMVAFYSGLALRGTLIESPAHRATIALLIERGYLRPGGMIGSRGLELIDSEKGGVTWQEVS